eukprot:125470_1
MNEFVNNLLKCARKHHNHSCDISHVAARYLSSIRLFKSFNNMIMKESTKHWKRKQLRQTCLRDACNVQRQHIKEKFMKCSKCFIASYCCRKCAKFDWKFGVHKRYCKQYENITKINSCNLMS